MVNRTEWLVELTNARELFSIPKGIEFIMKFRSDTVYSTKSVVHRIAIYFWWKNEISFDYPDFNWEISDEELRYLNEITPEQWRNIYYEAVHEYLKSDNIHIKNIDVLLLNCFYNVKDKKVNIYENPIYLFIYRVRLDLKLSFDVNELLGEYSLLRWWGNGGSEKYPRLCFDVGSLTKNACKESMQENGFYYPELIHSYYNSRYDLIENFNLSNLSGVLEYYNWWCNEPANLVEFAPWDVTKLYEQILSIVHFCGDIYLPLIMVSILNERKDLQDIFVDNGVLSKYDYLEWWDSYGKEQYQLVNNVSFLKDEFIQYNDYYYPLFVGFYYDDRDDLKSIYDISTLSGLLDFHRWWEENNEIIPKKIKWEATKLRNQLLKLTYYEAGNKYLPRIMLDILEERNDLKKAFIVDDILNIPSYIRWWNEHGVKHYTIVRGLSFTDEGVNVVINKERDFGVNVIGFAQGMLGIGEDARLAAENCLPVTNDNVCIINAPIPGPEKKIPISDKFELKEYCTYPISLFCLPPTEMVRMSLEGGKYLINGDRYNIGAWPWELPHWPTAFSNVRYFVDEIWAQSEYVKQCFLKDGGVPVYKVPMEVSIPKVTANLREQLKIKKDAFVFYLMFDGNSWLSRKNPIAGVKAFKLAFLDNKEPDNVMLVIKAMNINYSDPMWKEIEAIANTDLRIQIIVEAMSRQEVINFMASCDCYISLHRSEGFGRVIAESMLLQQPVVVSNYSGNIDFCLEDTSFLVDGELIPTNDGEYIFNEGQYWFDADIEKAALKMRDVYFNRKKTAKIAKNARQYILDNYSNVAVSQAYEQRLKKIWSKLNER